MPLYIRWSSKDCTLFILSLADTVQNFAEKEVYCSRLWHMQTDENAEGAFKSIKSPTADMGSRKSADPVETQG